MLLAAVRGATAQVDPVAVQQHWLDALARGDVAGALALLTDDAVIDAPSGPL
jgi:ketosteroid isomerase-like protein